MTIFKTLDAKEEMLFKQWAVDVFTPNMVVNPLWHPVVVAEISRLQAEFNAAQEAVETPYGEELDGGFDCDDGQFDNDPSPYDGTYSED